MRAIVALVVGASTLALALLPARAAAGIEIHLGGTARSEADARAAAEEADAFAAAHGWAVQREPGGVVLFPHPRCEPLALIFEGRTLLPASAKTQYAGPQVHADLVAMLAALRPRFEQLTVEDEGEYWPGADRAVLEARFRKETAAIEQARAAQPDTRGPVWAMGGKLVDLVTGAFPPEAAYDGPPRPIVPPAGWHHVTAPEAGFTVLMPPGEPRRIVTTVDGLPYVAYEHEEPKAGRRYLILTWFWGKPVDPRATQFARGQFLEMEGGVLVRERIATPRGGLDLELERAGGKGRTAARFIDSGQRAYQVQVIQDGPGPLAPEALAFLASFRPRVSEPPPKAAPAAPAVAVQPVPAGKASTGWRRLEARGEGFAVDLPGEATRAASDEGVEAGWTLLAPAGAPSFRVGTWTLPDVGRARNGVTILADSITAASPGARASGEGPVGPGLTARVIVYQDGTVRAEHRVLAVGRRLHQLTIVAEGFEPSAEDVRRFFGSFEPLPDRPDGPAPDAAPPGRAPGHAP